MANWWTRGSRFRSKHGRIHFSNLHSSIVAVAKKLRPFRSRKVTYVMSVMLAGLVVVLLYVPSLRNVLLQRRVHALWADIPTLHFLKIYFSTLSSTTSALAACTQPAHARSSRAAPGHLNPLEQLLASEPPGKVKVRLKDKADYTRAWRWINQTAEKRRRYRRFGPKLTPEQKTQLLLTWRVVHEALKLNNISHYLVGGSLMGALRHRGIIPWDDDIDVAVDERDVDKIMRALSCIPGYTLHLQRSLHWKFFPNESHIMKVYSKATVLQPRELSEAEKKLYSIEWYRKKNVVRRSPFVDLFLMNRDETYTWCHRAYDMNKCLFRLEDVYPLMQIYFEGYLAHVPRRSHFIVNSIYQANSCTSDPIDHLDGSSTLTIKDKVSIECRELAEMYTSYRIVSQIAGTTTRNVHFVPHCISDSRNNN